ncbi:hypothetical protein 1 [Beihai shrimp virus 6]|uniref:hypothetical protein 1 n=1 Tax=Beihai shrimp virus 6 TaxID=1922672 RepID=UPI00090AEAB1|nr:hypothetical protein 1 [Beihai shrimp virus 6]APG76114.1 hypothetical protein 1 [Beihai shrimp virus 6]APG76157.1 hypothetical protein 1 [Beihai shrimp virus 6]
MTKRANRRLNNAIASLQALTMATRTNIRAARAPVRSAPQPRPGRNRRRRNNRGSVPGGYTTGSAGPLRTSGTNGGVRIRHEEMFLNLRPRVAGENIATQIFLPGQSKMPVLDSFARSFDRYRIHSLTLRYKTASGTTKTGSVILGIDGAVDHVPTTIAQVQGLYPKWRGPVWGEGAITANIATLMPQRWLTTSTDVSMLKSVAHAAFAVVVGLTSAEPDVSPGEIWCSYDVEFMYPTGSGN